MAKHYVVVERTDKHGSPNGTPRLQAITGKGDGLDLAWFAADSPGGVHIWRFTDEEKANDFYRSHREQGVIERAEKGPKMSLLGREFAKAREKANGLGDPNELARLAGLAEGLEQAIWIMEGRCS